jgi:hypothetical protein
MSQEIGIDGGKAQATKDSEEDMKKRAKQAKPKSSKRAMVKVKAKKTTKARTSSRSKKTAVRTPASKLKQVAKKTATAAVVAAGVAALDTALGELKPEEKGRPVRASDDTETKG